MTQVDRPYDIEGKIALLEAEVSRLRVEGQLLALQNLRVISLLMNIISKNDLNKQMRSEAPEYTYIDRLEEIFNAIDNIVSHNDDR